jgi:hypothetical protein
MTKREKFYCQCRMRRPIDADRCELLISWIPEEIAKVGNTVKLRNGSDEEWSEGWIVTSVGERRPYSWLVPKSHDYTTQRKASDV